MIRQIQINYDGSCKKKVNCDNEIKWNPCPLQRFKETQHNITLSYLHCLPSLGFHHSVALYNWRNFVASPRAIWRCPANWDRHVGLCDPLQFVPSQCNLSLWHQRPGNVSRRKRSCPPCDDVTTLGSSKISPNILLQGVDNEIPRRTARSWRWNCFLFHPAISRFQWDIDWSPGSANVGIQMQKVPRSPGQHIRQKYLPEARSQTTTGSRTEITCTKICLVKAQLSHAADPLRGLPNELQHASRRSHIVPRSKSRPNTVDSSKDNQTKLFSHFPLCLSASLVAKTLTRAKFKAKGSSSCQQLHAILP